VRGARRREDQLALSFNGGKDCTVLLHLYAAVLAKRRRQAGCGPVPAARGGADRPEDVPLPPDAFSDFDARVGTDPAVMGEPRVRSVYIYQPDPFREVELFLDGCAARYHLAVSKIETPSMRQGLERFLNAEPTVRAVLVGTRRTDPYAGTALPTTTTKSNVSGLCLMCLARSHLLLELASRPPESVLGHRQRMAAVHARQPTHRLVV